MVVIVCSWVIDDVFSFVFGSKEPGKSNSEIDNDQSYSRQQEDYVLNNGTNVTAESHVATLLGTLKVSSIIVIRCLYNQSMVYMICRSDTAATVYSVGSLVNTESGKADHRAVMVAKLKNF